MSLPSAQGMLAGRPMSTVVVYVHGLWLRGHEATLLRRRVGGALGAETLLFTYPSVGATVTENAAALRRYLTGLTAETLHLVAHSLGGLVVLKMFEGDAAVGSASTGGGWSGNAADARDAVEAVTKGRKGDAAVNGNPAADAVNGLPADGLPPGRIVLLGSPVQGSHSARRLARLPFGLGSALLGLTAGEVLLSARVRRWSGARDLGVIAGDLAFGAGRLLGAMPAPNDGTVLVRETDLPGATEQLRLRVSHSGMPFSAVVARQVSAFLREGRFMR